MRGEVSAQTVKSFADLSEKATQLRRDLDEALFRIRHAVELLENLEASDDPITRPESDHCGPFFMTLGALRTVLMKHSGQTEVKR